MVLLADEELLFFVVATRVTFICFKKKKKTYDQVHSDAGFFF
jgi:hypothetical protein